jgi:hypothetical protein
MARIRSMGRLVYSVDFGGRTILALVLLPANAITHSLAVHPWRYKMYPRQSYYSGVHSVCINRRDFEISY